MLMLHNGCHLVTREELQNAPIPEASGRHKPVPHHVLAETMLGTADRLGLALRQESWGLSDNGMKLYGALDFAPPAGLSMPEGTGPSLGIRHANDKTMSIQLTAGARVLVCDNGALLGDIEAIHRKHTNGLHLEALIQDGIQEYLDRLPDFTRWHDNMKNARINDTRAKALIHDAFLEHQVMAPKYLPAVSNRYFKDEEHRHQFRGRNRWVLYNAFTEVFKQEPVTLQTASFHALGRALAPSSN